MDYEEFRDIMKKHVEKGQGIEIHKDDWDIMFGYIDINKATICRCSNIKIINGIHSKNIIWIDSNIHIDLKEIENFKITPIRSYLNR